ncbi:MAG: TrlF family AAA-like ATPase [Candidatus Desantisbacteria bacterium]
MKKAMELFKNGSVWLKADFHLHTKADKEFLYNGTENDFVKSYIMKLKENNIGIGIITNHNKFDKDEFKALRKKAKEEEIFLLAGVELSVNDGANGIHCLIVFDYENWVVNNDNFIEQFLNSAFEGIANRENGNTCCKYNLTDLLKKLEEHRKDGRDAFIVMAHVEQENGFCKALDGGRIKQIVVDELFSRNVLAFQKMRTVDIKNKLLLWFGGEDRLPSFVEGSDCKNIDAVGKAGLQNGIEKATYLKIGDFNFAAVDYALTDKDNRIKVSKPLTSNSYIKSISFEGGLLDGKEINLSPELNNFIGIRGSGKSSILEILRYTLGISLSGQAVDKDYKNELIEHVLKSGGKVKVTVLDEHGEEYRIEKIYGQKEDIFKNGTRTDVSISAVLKQPVYFGQKDLSNKDINFETDLVNKLIGNHLNDIRSKITAKKMEIKDIIDTCKRLDNLEEIKKETADKLKDAEHKLRLFEEKGVAEKLRQQSQFDSDISRLEEAEKTIKGFLYDLNLLIENYKPFFQQSEFTSNINKEIFNETNSIFKQLVTEFEIFIKTIENTKKLEDNFNKITDKLKAKKESLKDEFGKIKREINIPNLNPDEFLKLNRIIEISTLKLKEIDNSEVKRREYEAVLNNKISELNNLWHEEYKILEREVKRINESENQLSIEVAYKGRRDKFLDKQGQIFRRSGITEANYNRIQEKYKDFIEIYRDINNLDDILNVNHFAEYRKRFFENLAELLTYQVENKFIIKYNSKPLKNHSLGQRATALILFLLAQKEMDVLIIDQPEDDLDNQTIYNDVIKEIKSLKGDMQFIFATHNANIPVLGDSEKIFACAYSENKMDVQDGTIDNREIQESIVAIMEGGKEAFYRRKEIYRLWRVEK